MFVFCFCFCLFFNFLIGMIFGRGKHDRGRSGRVFHNTFRTWWRRRRRGRRARRETFEERGISIWEYVKRKTPSRAAHRNASTWWQHLLFWMCLSRWGFRTDAGVCDSRGDQHGDIYLWHPRLPIFYCFLTDANTKSYFCLGDGRNLKCLYFLINWHNREGLRRWTNFAQPWPQSTCYVGWT